MSGVSPSPILVGTRSASSAGSGSPVTGRLGGRVRGSLRAVTCQHRVNRMRQNRVKWAVLREIGPLAFPQLRGPILYSAGRRWKPLGTAHNPKVVGSNPAPATNKTAGQTHDGVWPVLCFGLGTAGWVSEEHAAMWIGECWVRPMYSESLLRYRASDGSCLGGTE